MIPIVFSRRRDGFVLVLSILLLLTLGLLALGMVAVASREGRIAAAMAATLRARAAAEGAVRATLGDWSTRREKVLPAGGARAALGAAGVRLRIERLDTVLFLVTATSEVPFGPALARASAGALVRTVDADRLAAIVAPAAASVAGEATLRGGTLSGADLCAAEPPRPGLLGPDLRWSGTQIHGDPPVLPIPLPPGALDRIPFRDLQAVRPDGTVGSPRPQARSGACLPGPWNWRTPDASHPCGTPALIHVEGDLTVRGGRGFGVLVVDGDLTATGGFSFDGFILVRGRALLHDAAIHGGLRAHQLELRSGEIRYDACRLSAAFRAPAFDRPFRLPGRWWVPAF